MEPSPALSATADTEKPALNRWAPWARSPIIVLAIYTALSLIIRENFPFSNFPMYSNPSADRMYYTISGPDGIGLPVQTLTGITSPKIGKIYRKKTEEFANKTKIKPSAFTPEQVGGIGLEIISYLRNEARNLGNLEKMPPKLQINRIWISYEDGQIVERPSVIAQE